MLQLIPFCYPQKALIAAQATAEFPITITAENKSITRICHRLLASLFQHYNWCILRSRRNSNARHSLLIKRSIFTHDASFYRSTRFPRPSLFAGSTPDKFYHSQKSIISRRYMLKICDIQLCIAKVFEILMQNTHQLEDS